MLGGEQIGGVCLTALQGEGVCCRGQLRKTGEGCVSEECRGRQVNDWDCETHVIAESQASVSPKSIQLAHYEIFRKNFGLTSLKLYHHPLIMKNFV